MEKRQIYTPSISSKEQLATIFIKGVTSSMFESITNKLGLVNIFELTWGRMLEYYNLI